MLCEYCTAERHVHSDTLCRYGECQCPKWAEAFKASDEKRKRNEERNMRRLTMNPRELKADEVTFEVLIEEEDVLVRGNVMASGDAKADRKEEDRIIAELNAGNVYAWCFVRVVARWQSLEGVATLGCCSYANREELNADVIDGGYRLKEEALQDLNRNLEALVKAIAERL